MLKKTTLGFIFTLLLVPCFSQESLDRLMIERAPTPEDIAYNCTKLIVKYYERNDYDSAKIILAYWDSKSYSHSEPVIRTKILFAIKDGTFDESIYSRSILSSIISYTERLEPNKSNNRYYYYSPYFGYVAVNEKFDLFTQSLAKSLLPDQPEQSLSQLFCQLYANEQVEPFKELQENPNFADTKLKSYYDNDVRMYRDMLDYHYSVFAGVWVPTGNASLLGNHPFLGFQAGFRSRKMTYNLDFAVRFGNTANSYQVVKDGELQTTNYFFGIYAGFEVEREMLRIKKSQLDLLAGVGYDGFDAIEKDQDSDKKGVSMGSLNVNLGLGYRFYFNKGGYVALQGKYNFVNYKNAGGTNLSGNTITLALLVGVFNNSRKQYYLETLKYSGY